MADNMAIQSIQFQADTTPSAGPAAPFASRRQIAALRTSLSDSGVDSAAITSSLLGKPGKIATAVVPQAPAPVTQISGKGARAEALAREVEATAARYVSPTIVWPDVYSKAASEIASNALTEYAKSLRANGLSVDPNLSMAERKAALSSTFIELPSHSPEEGKKILDLLFTTPKDDRHEVALALSLLDSSRPSGLRFVDYLSGWQGACLGDFVLENSWIGGP